MVSQMLATQNVAEPAVSAFSLHPANRFVMPPLAGWSARTTAESLEYLETVLKARPITLGLFTSLFLFVGTLDSPAQSQGADAAKKAESLARIKSDQPEAIYELQKASEGIAPAAVKGDSAWMLLSTGLVMLMVPGLALFYGGMVRRKN